VHVAVLQEDLSKGLGVAGRAVAQRSPLPITTNILLETDDGRLKLSATNLEIAITTWVPATVTSEGKITLPARLLTEFVNALPNETVTLMLKAGSHTVHIHAGRFEADIRGMDADDFPRIPQAEEEPTARINAKLLKEMIEQVVFAAATDDTRPVLTGVQFVFSGDELTMAAADSFRLAIRTDKLDGPAIGDCSVIIPARTLTELSKILPDGDEPVAITVTPNRSQVVFESTNLHVVSRLIEGTFPNVKQLVPTKFQTKVIVNTGELLKATKVASFFSRDNSNMIVMDIVPSKDEDEAPSEVPPAGLLTVTGAAAELGENHSALDAVVQGEKMSIAFNARYIADVLGVVDTEQVELEFTGPTSAAVLRPVDSVQYTHVVMPMHTAR
jgi:DNA polymerase-3 subunit beta